MLDIKYIREHKKEVLDNCKNRGSKADIELLIKLDAERSILLGKIENIRAGKNLVKGKPSQDQLEKLSEEKSTESKLEKELDRIETELKEIWFSVPNITHPDVRISDDEDDNPVLEIVKEPLKLNFVPKDHLELAKLHDLIDFDRATKVSGSKFYYLKNELAQMEFALIQYALDITIKNGYTPLSTPDLAKNDILYGLGFNPRGESTQVYNISGTDLSLIGTAEITIGGYHAGEVLEEVELPKKYVAVSHCFRTEAGSYSKFSKGIFRVHQFTKIEMFQYVVPENAEKAHQEILNIEKEIFSGLEVPYRVIDHCTADLGAPAIRTFDLEAWMPGKPNKDGTMGDWGEITSTSNCTDYQSRALNIKYKNISGDKNFVYMINGTAIAITRAIIAIVENCQQSDGSILIPKVLEKYMNKKIIDRSSK
ncbi:MAG: serine--tRNA ligase [bacterium]